MPAPAPRTGSRLSSGIPRAAVEKDHGLAVGAGLLGRVEIERAARTVAIGNIGLKGVAALGNGRVENCRGRAAADQRRDAPDQAATREAHAPARARTCSA